MEQARAQHDLDAQSASRAARPTLTNNAAYDLPMAVADGTLDAVDQILRLATATKPW